MKHIIIISDIVYMNNNVNDLDVDELLINIRLKFSNLDKMGEKMFQVAQIDADDEIVQNMNDIIDEQLEIEI